MFAAAGALLCAAAIVQSPPPQPSPTPPPPPPEELARRGLEAASAGDLPAATRLLYDARTLLPQSPTVRIELARVLARQGQERSAMELLRGAAAMGVATDLAALDAAFPAGASDPYYQSIRTRFAANGTPVVRSTVAFTLPDRTLLPESVAYDPKDRAFYVGSMHRRKILRVDPDGRVSDLVATARDGLLAVLGMKVDAPRRELWANSCDTRTDPPMDPPAAEGDPTGALHRYELPGGRLLGRYPFPSTPDGGTFQCFNDLAFDAEGNVYLSAGDRGVFRWSRATAAVEAFAPLPGLLVNGIAVAEDGRTLYVASHTRGVVAVEIESKRFYAIPVPPDETLAGVDGLYVKGRTLIAIQNGLRHGPHRVLRATLVVSGVGVERVEVLERAHPAYAVPTTGVLVGDDLYYVAASNLEGVDQAGRLLPAEKLAETVILRLPLGG